MGRDRDARAETRSSEAHLLLPFRVWTVRVGVITTALALWVLALYPLLPGHRPVDGKPYAVLLVSAAVGAAVIALLPWPRLLTARHGMALFYLWSVCDILLITAAIGVSGGDQSPLFAVYALTTVFFALGYPRAGQAALLAFTVACYVALVVLTHEHVGAAVVFMRTSLLGCLTVMGSFLSSRLLRQVRELGSAREDADRRSGLLAAVAVAARDMNILDPDQVLSTVVEAVLEIGFEAANLCVFNEAGTTYRVVHGHGLPHEYLSGTHPANVGMPGLVRESGETVVLNDYASHPRGVPRLRIEGFRAVIASPLRSKERLAAVLVGGTKRQSSLEPEVIEAFELLSRQAEVALTNAEQFEAERRLARRLAELDRLKRDFVATVSHELRTPLTVIKGMGKTLVTRGDELTDELREECLQRMVDNCDVLGETIENLLDFSRLEAGRLEATAVLVDLSRLLQGSLNRLSSLFGERTLTSSVTPGMWVVGDPHLIERVVENLLANASKHSNADAHVTVALQRDADDAVLSVADDGPGIAADDLQHLGERFFRGGDVLTRGTRGTGLGIAFALEVLQLHGSDLDVKTELGVGTTFSFRLPLAPSAEHTAPQAAEPTGEQTVGSGAETTG